MTKLANIYNPVSDTFLRLERQDGFFGRRFVHYREVRTPDYLISKGIHDGRFGLCATRNPEKARRQFEARLVTEADRPLRDIVRSPYGFLRKDGLRGRFIAAAGELNSLLLWQKFGGTFYFHDLADAQRRTLYDFENEFFGRTSSKRLNDRQVRKLVRRVSDDYGLAMPDVGFRDHVVYERSLGEKRPIRAHAYCGDPGALEFFREKGLVCKRIVLHEMAHLVTWNCNDDAVSHGPHFAMTAAQLYDRYFGIDREKYFALANEGQYRIFGPESVRAEAILEDNRITGATMRNIAALEEDIINMMLHRILNRPRL